MLLTGCGDRPQKSDVGPADGTAATQPEQPSGAAREIERRLADGAAGEPALPKTELADLQQLYQPGHHTPLWFDTSRKLTPAADQALALLGAAAAEGLDPAEYGAEALATQVRSMKEARQPVDADVASLDLALSRATLRYLRHLHAGRIDPKTVGFQMPAKAAETDFAAALRPALEKQRLEDAVAQLRPPLEQYRSLRAMLARYRTLASQPAPAPLPAVPRELKPGEAYSGAPALRERLVLLGDLPVDTPPLADGGRYDGALVDGVKKFQARHGLPAEGVLGKGTVAALNVPLDRRVRQIELALERLRWFPHLENRPFVGINIPMYRLWAGGPQALDGRTALDMDVIVGGALDTETPAMVEEMRYVVFSPYWNVPTSIVRKEILPALARDPQYLVKHEMELVRGGGDDAAPVEATPENLEQLAQGQLRVRQRPGQKNSLGPAKFIFPNDDSVYLHGTPAQQLFDRSRRDLSHGCVRLENPLALAQWVLRDQPEWTKERIEAAMGGGEQVKVDLKQPVQVLLFYITAMVAPEDGALHFADDIYGHDKKLDQALAERRT
ncbi:L,D-transpeptidase family protein [Caldimonas brevitalea]|nr:L,D-transpeptidase family protein [Caldimonas brevitalea]